MGWFTGLNLDSFETLFLEQLQDLYDAEQRLVKALPKMAEAAHDSSLRNSLPPNISIFSGVSAHRAGASETVQARPWRRMFQGIGCIGATWGRPLSQA